MHKKSPDVRDKRYLRSKQMYTVTSACVVFAVLQRDNRNQYVVPHLLTYPVLRLVCPIFRPNPGQRRGASLKTRLHHLPTTSLAPTSDQVRRCKSHRFYRGKVLKMWRKVWKLWTDTTIFNNFKQILIWHIEVSKERFRGVRIKWNVLMGCYTSAKIAKMC